MCITTLIKTMARIKVATPDSPISVFIIEKKVNKKVRRYLDSQFANTVGAARNKKDTIKPRSTDEGLPNYKYEWIGDYHKFSQVKAVRALLKVALER